MFTALADPSTSSFRDNPPNARRTIEALRELGYDSYASVLDLIDNSIDAQATQIEITVSELKGDIIIVIEDDGSGMDEETLDEALRIGSDTLRDTGDLGKFGIGLVTASIGLSRRVEVFTRESGGTLLFGGFDLDQIADEDRFVKWLESLDDSQLSDVLTTARGTRIRLSKTDRISNRSTSTFANTLRKSISQTFRKFLKAGLRITVNGRPAEAIDPLMLAHPETRLVLETEMKADGENTITLRVVDLPDFGPAGNKEQGIIPQNSGFYILRNNREIMEAQTFEFYKKHGDVSHFRAEVAFAGSLDSVFHTDVKKMSITPSQSFLDHLRQATQSLISESSRRGRERANVQRGQINHSMAESNITRRAQLIPKPKALVEKRASQPRKGAPKKGMGEKPQAPHVTDLKTISGLRVEFLEGNYGEGPFYQVGQQGRTITVTYNREHPFWREFVEHASEPKMIATLDYLVFALANAELLVPEQATIVKANVNTTLVGLLV